MERKPESNGDTGGSTSPTSLNKSILVALETRSGRNKLRRVLGLPEEREEWDSESV